MEGTNVRSNFSQVKFEAKNLHVFSKRSFTQERSLCAHFVQLSMYTTIIISGWRHIAVGSFIWCSLWVSCDSDQQNIYTEYHVQYHIFHVKIELHSCSVYHWAFQSRECGDKQTAGRTDAYIADRPPRVTPMRHSYYKWVGQLSEDRFYDHEAWTLFFCKQSDCFLSYPRHRDYSHLLALLSPMYGTYLRYTRRETGQETIWWCLLYNIPLQNSCTIGSWLKLSIDSTSNPACTRMHAVSVQPHTCTSFVHNKY